ncbi:MAG TPA: glycerophosphodiester phosphodiesterase family protein [bacterium]|nr:glycerophosphodiester phosphodiesterase family protein [bacterium]
MKKSMMLVVIMVAALVGSAAWAGEGMLKIGHRGARGLSDENTLESLQLAAELGVDWVEFDIQRTQEGVFVLMHDDTVDRTTDGTGRVDQMTLAQFKKLKTGSGYTPPTFEEVLEWLKQNNIGFIIDIKITDPERAKALIALVESHGLTGRAIFESPDPKVAGMIEKMRPDLVTAVYPTNMLGMRYYLKKYGIDYASYYYPFANPLEIKLAQRMGRKVMVWTVDKPAYIKWFKKLGVNGLMTDDPNLFKQ